MTYYNGDTFSGTWKAGMRYEGVFVLSKKSRWAGNRYEGQWKNDR